MAAMHLIYGCANCNGLCILKQFLMFPVTRPSREYMMAYGNRLMKKEFQIVKYNEHQKNDSLISLREVAIAAPDALQQLKI